jgi:ribonuclease VapC
LGEEGGRKPDLLLLKAGVEIIPFNEAPLKIARRAFRAFGKRRHPAGLNYGDCFSDALSMTTGEPLLFKGTDFTKTDVRAALPPCPDSWGRADLRRPLRGAFEWTLQLF